VRKHAPSHSPIPRLGGFGRVVLALALVGGLGLYLQMEKKVVLSVDGSETTVRTFAGTVGDFLGSRGIEVGEHDEVTPELASPIEDGMRVEVQIAKEITLVMNGAPRTIYVTGQTVDEVLQQVDVRESGAYVHPSRGATVEEGDTIVFRETVSVALAADGHQREIITNAPTVGYLLDSMGIILRARDRVEPGAETMLERGMKIQVVRVRFKQITEKRAIPFDTDVRQTDDLVEGERRIEQAGRAGLEETVFMLRLENEKEVGRRLIERRIVSQPVTQIELVGTRPPQTQYGDASWYERTGMVAAHQTLPFGTRVKVTNTDTGESVYVTINDRGPYVDGRIIDLSDDAFSQLAPLSNGTINVRISW